MEDVFTLDEIKEYICKHPEIVVSAEDTYDYWKKKDWKTLKGTIVKTLAAAVSSYNGAVIFKDRTGNVKANSNDNIRKLKKETYHIYQEYKKQLERPEWKAFREFIFVVRGQECELCKRKKNLQIHHIRYVRGRYAWEYTSKDVRVLCSICHEYTHGINVEDED